MTDTWPPAVAALTLFTDNLVAAKEFYGRFFDAAPIHEEADSAVFRAGAAMVNLLRSEAVPELIDPAAPGTGVRAVYTLPVADVDATCAALAKRGIAVLNGPMDRPWGIRTACVQDPSGHVWELAT